jgi:metallophosphoesterase superfamily enzyme
MRVLDDWLLTAERVAVHLPSATGVLADPHLGYAQARRRSGEAVPGDCLDEQLAGLLRVREKHGVMRVVIAGDLLEEGSSHSVLGAFEEWLDRNGIHLTAVVPGNHDGGVTALGNKDWIYPEGFLLGRWQVRHGDGPLPDGLVVHGHEHPCLRWTPRSRVIRPRPFDGRSSPNAIESPCYLVGPGRLVLPAFSADAAGVNVLSVRRWRTYRCCVIAGEQVVDFGELATLRPRLTAAGRRRDEYADGRRQTSQ